MPKPLDYANPRSAVTQVPSGDRWHVHSRGLLLLMIVLLPIAGAVIYAGPVATDVGCRLVSDGALLLLWLAGATGLGLFVLRTAKLHEQQTPVALHFATAAALGLGIESLALLGLGLAGWLNGPVAWALLFIGCGAGGFLMLREREKATYAFLRWLKQPAGWEWLWLLAIPFLAIALTAAMAPPGMLWNPGEPHGYDVVEYHLQVPREWYEGGRIVPLEHNVFSYFPFNVELHFLLAMHLRQDPWAAMYLAQLMHGAFMGLMVLAVNGFAIRLCRTPSAPTTPAPAIIAALSLLTVPWLIQVASIAYDEGGFLLFGILAIGWSLSATFETKNRLGRFALAGLMGGFAAGSKLTGVPEVLVAIPIVSAAVALWFTLTRRNSVEKRGRWGGIVLFCLTGLLAFSPWLARNMAWAHNPVFPELMPLLGHDHFNAAQVDRWEKAHKPPAPQQSAGARVAALRDQVALGWQFGYMLLPLGLIAFALSVRRPQAWFLLGLLLILTAFWLGFTHLQARFFLLAAPIAALLVAQMDWRFSGFLRPAVGRHGSILATLLVSLFATLAWWKTNQELFSRLYGPAGNKGALVLGIDHLKWLSMDRLIPEGVPDNVTLVLVGDARAFWYPGVPMSRLKYRTVFDVKGEGQDFVAAWAGQGANRESTWRVIDPPELIRLSKTYRNLPDVPEDVVKDGVPYVDKR